MAHQDDFYYEIQLTNKQLVFYFMAGAAGLILSFLAGVMVGRGVDGGAADVLAARTPVHEDKVVAEEPVKTMPVAEDLGYPQRLEGEKVDTTLASPTPKKAGEPAKVAANVPPPAPAKPPARVSAEEAAAEDLVPANVAPAPPATTPPAPSAARPTPVPRAAAPKPVPSAEPAAARPVPAAAAPARAPEGQPGTFSIQVGAFKDRGSADQVVSRLKGKGFAAFVVSPATPDGLFNVRVGSFAARVDAEKVQGRLRDQEKFKPFIVRQ